MNFAPATPYYESHKAKTEKMRIENMKNIITDIKTMLIQKQFGFDRDLTSQESVLFQVVFLLKGIDLSSQFQDRILRQISDSKLSNEEKMSLKRRREQYRRDKQEAAFEKLEEFLLENGMGNLNGSKMTRIHILNTIRNYISVLSAFSSPTFPQTPCPAPSTSLSYGIDKLLAPSTPQRSQGYCSSGYSTPGSSTSSSPSSNFMMSNLLDQEEEEEEDEEIDIIGL